MLDHFKDYTDIVGDHPQNLQATTLAFNAFALTHEQKYKDWVLEYVDAWATRAAANKNILPSNIGLDGTIGGETGGKWYGGAYGWGFSVVVPQTGDIAHRSRTASGWMGFRSAFLLTGDDKYLDVWRKQIDAVNANRKMDGGRWLYPRMHGDHGWYAWDPAPYSEKALELYALSMRADDLQRAPRDPWLDYLRGENPDYPERALKQDLERIRTRVAEMRADTTTPDTRLSDDPMLLNPASVKSLVELTLGGVHPGIGGNTLTARVRYFDPDARRPGLPADVAALVDRLTNDEATLTLVNINQLAARTLIVQGGAYGEHEITSLATSGQSIAVAGPLARVHLAPGCGAKLTLKFKRHSRPPTFALPWHDGRGTPSG
jgi:hypothetical protein